MFNPFISSKYILCLSACLSLTHVAHDYWKWQRREKKNWKIFSIVVTSVLPVEQRECASAMITLHCEHTDRTCTFICSIALCEFFSSLFFFVFLHWICKPKERKRIAIGSIMKKCNEKSKSLNDKLMIIDVKNSILIGL